MFSLASPLLMVIIAAAIYAAGFATGWTVDSWKVDAGLKRQAELAVAERDAFAEKAAADRAERELIAGRFEDKLANLRIVNRTINNEVRHEVERTVYGNPDCALPITGVRLRNTAIDAANGTTRPAAGKPDATVPADPADSGKRSPAVWRSIPSGPRPDSDVRGMFTAAPSIDRSNPSTREAIAALGL